MHDTEGIDSFYSPVCRFGDVLGHIGSA
jgi:hypothetical protein